MLHKLIRRILSMCEPAYSMLRGVLILSCVMVFCAFFILVGIGSVTTQNYRLFLCAAELAKAPIGLLLIASIGTVFIEEHELRR